MSDDADRRVRGGRRRAARAASLRGRKLTLVMALAAMVLTGGAVSSGVLGGALADDVTGDLGSVIALQSGEADVDRERRERVSRSDTRGEVAPEKQALLAPGQPRAEAGEQKLSAADPRSIARALLAEFGFDASQFGCLDSLWMKESRWNPRAQNPSSGAYGIPQSLPGSKMASVASDWRTNPATQIRWGLGYIKQRYGTPCAAWAHSQRRNWY